MAASMKRTVRDRERPAERDLVDGRLAYRPAELAAMVGLSAKAIYRAIERGELDAAKVANGSRLLIPAAAAEDWLVANAVVPRGAEKPADQLRAGSVGRPLGKALAKLDDAPEPSYDRSLMGQRERRRDSEE